MSDVHTLDGPLTVSPRQRPAFRQPADINRCYVCDVPIPAGREACRAHETTRDPTPDPTRYAAYASSAVYRVIRYFLTGRRVTVARGLTLEQAQAHIANPETSSQTATSATARARTRKYGSWFDGYRKD